MIGPLTEAQDARRIQCIELAGEAFADVLADMRAEQAVAS